MGNGITMQTSSARLREKALLEAPNLETLVKLGSTLECTDSQPVKMSHTEVVSHINKNKWKLSKVKEVTERKHLCNICFYDKNRAHQKGVCPARNQQCRHCKKTEHFAEMCTRSTFRQVLSNSNSEYPNDSDDLR